MRRPNRIPNVLDYVTPSGSRIHEIREGRWNGDALVLTVIGTEDIQDRIQAYAPYCDLHYMLHCLGRGDNSVCTKRPPLYGDLSGMPDNPVDTINMINNARDRFDALTLDVRQKYNNDYLKWLTSKMSSGKETEKTE